MTSVAPLQRAELYDKSAERCLLGRLFLENRYYLEVHDLLCSGDFYLRENQQAYIAFQAVYLREGRAEVAAVFEELKGTGVSIASLSGTMDDAMIYRSTDWPLKRVLALSNRRRLQNGLLQIEQSLGVKEDAEVCQELIDLANQTRRIKGKVYGSSDLADLAFELMEKRREKGDPIQGFRTGFGTVDFHTGGLQGKRLTLISGPTGHGKTGLAINWFTNLSIRSRQ